MKQPIDSLPISGLQHILFCPRQCALIHLEQVWRENELTAEGRILHERPDAGKQEMIKGCKVERSVHLYSAEYGIHGVADVVEYRKEGKIFIPRPVEYKHGKPKKGHEDEVQLCAQALCLEEMHGITLEAGDLFYGKTRRRQEILFDESLRQLTGETILAFRKLLEQGITPPAEYRPCCNKCSLEEICMPHARRFAKGTDAWNKRQLEAALTSSNTEGEIL